MQYTPEEALQFAHQDRLTTWIERFLNSPGGNSAFGEGLCLAKRWWHVPHKLPLARVNRVVGSEPHMEYVQNKNTFEQRIQAMLVSLDTG